MTFRPPYDSRSPRIFRCAIFLPPRPRRFGQEYIRGWVLGSNWEWNRHFVHSSPYFYRVKSPKFCINFRPQTPLRRL